MWRNKPQLSDDDIYDINSDFQGFSLDCRFIKMHFRAKNSGGQIV